jgi:hypothetical protein
MKPTIEIDIIAPPKNSWRDETGFLPVSQM